MRSLTECPISDTLYDMPATEMAAEVGRNVRAEAGRRRVSMLELSKRTGIPRGTLIHQIDVSRLTVDNLMKIAKALEVPVSELLGEAVA